MTKCQPGRKSKKIDVNGQCFHVRSCGSGTVIAHLNESYGKTDEILQLTPNPEPDVLRNDGFLVSKSVLACLQWPSPLSHRQTVWWPLGPSRRVCPQTCCVWSACLWADRPHRNLPASPPLALTIIHLQLKEANKGRRESVHLVKSVPTNGEISYGFKLGSGNPSEGPKVCWTKKNFFFT